MGMGIGAQGTLQKILAYGHAPRHVHFFHQACGQGVQKFVQIEAVVVSIQIEILDVEEEEPGAGFAADQIEKFGVRQAGARRRSTIAATLSR
jgi:hypothetical protein